MSKGVQEKDEVRFSEFSAIKKRLRQQIPFCYLADVTITFLHWNLIENLHSVYTTILLGAQKSPPLLVA